jgi:protein-L-isoaspartate(D-aspartate) O-methyltransferase
MILLLILLIPCAVCMSCAAEADKESSDAAAWTARREGMVDVLRRYGIKDSRVLAAMVKVRRHVFIPEAYRHLNSAYGDHPSPIGYEQTISQPFIVAYMTEKMAVKEREKVLEIGTGSGYQAAVLAELGAEVYSIEIVPELAKHAREALAAEGYGGVHVLAGDGYKGWPEYAPFDAIIVTCAPDNVPAALLDQLREGGRMIVPVGIGIQRLVVLRKRAGKVEQEDDLAVRFVPMVRGTAEEGR